MEKIQLIGRNLEIQAGNRTSPLDLAASCTDILDP